MLESSLPQNRQEIEYLQSQIDDLVQQKHGIIKSFSGDYFEIIRLQWEIASRREQIARIREERKRTISFMRKLDRIIEIYRQLMARERRK